MKKIKANAAPYNQTSTSEQLSADILHSLLNRTFIKGNINVMDKVPNTDGTLTIVQSNQIPVGLLEVQLKTLKPADIKKPKFQCEIALLAYCQDSILPMILIVVDQQNSKAYWLHLDEKLITHIEPQIKGKSISVPLIPEQCIDRENVAYIKDWTDIVKAVQNKVQNYDVVVSQRAALSAQLGEFGIRLLPAFSLNQFAIREIHLFLDFLNNQFDHEFKAIKDILYYNYWKISIGIVEYEATAVRYFLIPQALSSNSPLIKELALAEEGVIEDLFMQDGAIALIFHGERNNIKEDPERSALRIVSQDVFKVVGKINLAIGHEFAAREYLSGFINTFCGFLGLEKKQKTISLERLRLLLFVLLPLLIDKRMNFAKGITDWTYGIDTFKENGNSRNNSSAIENTEREIAEGYLPTVNITLRSSLFDFNLIQYYLDFLSARGVQEISPVYLTMSNDSVNGNYLWESWIKEKIYENLKLFFENFVDIYNQLLADKFPYLIKELDFFGETDLIVYVLQFFDNRKPHLQYFNLTTEKHVDKKLLFYIADDPQCQFDWQKIDESKIRTLVVDEINYELELMGTHNIQFLFEALPTYTLLNEILGEKLDRYFKSKGLDRTNYRKNYY